MSDWKKYMEYSMDAATETEITIQFRHKAAEVEEFRERLLTKILPGIEELLSADNYYLACDIRPPTHYAHVSKVNTKEKSK